MTQHFTLWPNEGAPAEGAAGAREIRYLTRREGAPIMPTTRRHRDRSGGPYGAALEGIAAGRLLSLIGIMDPGRTIHQIDTSKN
jgi:hypothetical protein